jgi:NAD(P)H-hydrate epimerase
MERIYSSQCLKQVESKYNGISLMEKAASGIVSVVENHIKRKPLTIICGSGNNGGDGWAVASMLKNDVTVIYIKEPKTEEGNHYRNKYFGKAIHIEDECAFDIISSSEFILDCIFGIGLNSSATGIYEKVFNAVNNSNAFVISVDVPSGISSDNFEEFPHIKADITVSITSKKLSGVVSPTKYDFGKIYTVPIGLDMRSEKPIALCTDESVLDLLPKRPEYSNKGTFGTLKTLCGSVSMPGAGFLAITAALRTGVGLVKAFGCNNLLDIYKNRISEPIFKCFSKESFIEEKSSAALIGCGIANDYDDCLREIFKNINCPLVIDADGINFLSRNIDICEHIPSETVITPHPGEMARLCNCSIAEVEKNRFQICETVSKKLNCTVVLKGN